MNDESTSAALRRTEAERDAARAEAESWKDHAARHLAEVRRLEALVIERTAERDEARFVAEQWVQRYSDAIGEMRQGLGLADDYAKERDLARAELASARQELDLLRNQPTEGA